MIEEMFDIYCNTIYNYLKDRLNAHIYVGIHIEEGDIGIIFTMDGMLEKIICGDYPSRKVASMMMKKWKEAIYGWYFKSENKAV